MTPITWYLYGRSGGANPADYTALDEEVTELKNETTELKSAFEALGLSVVDGAINITYEEVA